MENWTWRLGGTAWTTSVRRTDVSSGGTRGPPGLSIVLYISAGWSTVPNLRLWARIGAMTIDTVESRVARSTSSLRRGPRGTSSTRLARTVSLPFLLSERARQKINTMHSRPQDTMPCDQSRRNPLRQPPRKGPDLLQGPLVRAGQLPQPAQLRVAAVLRGAQVHGGGVPAAAQEHHRRPGPGIGLPPRQPATQRRQRRRRVLPDVELLRGARVRRGWREVR